MSFLTRVGWEDQYHSHVVQSLLINKLCLVHLNRTQIESKMNMLWFYKDLLVWHSDFLESSHPLAFFQSLYSVKPVACWLWLNMQEWVVLIFLCCKKANKCIFQKCQIVSAYYTVVILKARYLLDGIDMLRLACRFSCVKPAGSSRSWRPAWGLPRRRRSSCLQRNRSETQFD